MKFREYKKLLAVITVSAMIAALPGSRVLAAPENVDGSVTNGNVESIIDNSFNLFPAEKNETVYVKTDANGKIRKIVVSDQLQNTGDTDTVKDHSNLTDIENVKGDESFKQSGSNLVWDNAGEDIVYQGESNAALPVGLSVTYELDGKKITPKKLEGKSGHLRVTYNYTNDLEQTGGRFTPFLMVTGVVLDQDHFKNVEVGSNGHFESGGQRMTVVGYSVPGLLDYLDIDEASADLSARLSLSNSFTFEADVEEYKTPLSGTIATNSIFSKMDSGDSIDSLDSLKSSLNTLADSSTQLVNGSAVLSSGVKELAGGASSLSSGVSKLTNGSRSLAEGTASLEKGAGQLNSGICQMNDEVGSSMPVLTNAMNQLATGAENLSSGISQAAAGAQAVSSGIGTVHESADQLAQGAASVESGVQAVADGAQKLAGGMQTAQASAAGLAQLAGSINTSALSPGDQTRMQQLIGGLSQLSGSLDAGAAQQLAAGADAAAEGAEKVSAGAQALSGATGSDGKLAKGAADIASALSAQGAIGSGASQLSGGLSQASGQVTTFSGTLTSALGQLATGAGSLAKGSSAVNSGAGQLANGINTLNSKIPTLTSGVDKLSSGAEQLADGMARFDKEGIQKLVDYMDGDVAGLLEKANEMLSNSKKYNNFSGIDEDMNGSVKFVFVPDEG